jgi:RNA polymerase sigma factor for flagellar operon FliA
MNIALCMLMRKKSRSAVEQERIESSLPFVEALARRLAASMSYSTDLSDLVQDGMIGMIDASERFDEKRGIKFETFAERRVRGAMIDALRKNAWPRGIRRVRRELEAAREKLRDENGYAPSLAELARHMGSDEERLGRTIVRIKTIESTSPLATSDTVDTATLPAVLVPSEPVAPDDACQQNQVCDRVRAAIGDLPVRERKVIGLYYYREVTMKQIGSEIGVNESRVSQLHARAIQRLRKLLGPDMAAEQLSAAFRALSTTMPAAVPTARTAASRAPKTGVSTALRGGTVVSYVENPPRRPHVRPAKAGRSTMALKRAAS